MGASFSAIFGYPTKGSFVSPSLGDLPESCVAPILEYLDPPEICKLARLNRAFRGASFADFVWESKLPSNYPSLIETVLGDVDDNLGRREIFSRLCRANTLDGGTKVQTCSSIDRLFCLFVCQFEIFVFVQRVWLDKSSGGVCLSISAKGLSITGIDDRRYWNHMPTDESR